ncbi:AzlC family ABC transporter permease [Salinarimonas chemoclinalis]|uniref:AzlC family ABC transporter permease n=1 Tax=Salinarimonas chemoclinalis TaxID=3241599 RepID=UPI003556880F
MPPEPSTDHLHDDGPRARFARVLRLTVPVAMAYLPLGVAFGVYLVSSGIAWYWAPLSAMIIFAGSIEFLAVSFIVAGLPLAVVAWTTFVVNFRHIFYGLSFPIGRLRTLPQKIYGVYALTDETYGITAAGDGRRLDGPGITLLQLVSHFWWILGAGLGAGLGAIIPPHIRGFEFALTAMFLILAVDAVRHSRDGRLVVYAAAACAAGFAAERLVADNAFLIAGLVVYLGLVSADWVRSPRVREEGRHAG